MDSDNNNELPQFELKCPKCGTGFLVFVREDLELPCPWCNETKMAVYERIR